MQKKIRTNNIMTALLAVVLLMLAAPAMAEPSTSFVIDGYVNDLGGNPCNDPHVRVTNVNTGVSWDAENASESNYYRLVLDSDDVGKGNVVEIDASGCLQSKVTHKTVSQDMINDGGFSKDVTLEGDEPPPQQPDLVITGKSETRTDETFTMTYTVANNGAGDADASTSGIYVNGVQVATDPVPALASGDSHTETVGTFDCPCGTTVTVKVCADNDDDVTESDETNNCQENELICQVSSMPDLVITGKSETRTDETFTMTYTVANNGAGDADASTSGIYVNGVQVATDPVPALASGDSHTETVGTFDCPCGTTVTVKVCADNDDDVTESDETNNCQENELICQVSSMPDLVITGKSETWVSTEYKTYSITYTIANTGAAGAIASTTSVTIDGICVATDPVPALASGDSHTNTLGPFTMSGDADAVMVCADGDGMVSESNETNNCRGNNHLLPPPSAMVPTLTPFGLLVLIGLLSIFSVMNIKKGGK